MHVLKHIFFFQKGGKLKGPYEKIFEDKEEVDMTNGNEHSDIIFEELQPGASYKISFSISLFEGMKTDIIITGVRPEDSKR